MHHPTAESNAVVGSTKILFRVDWSPGVLKNVVIGNTLRHDSELKRTYHGTQRKVTEVSLSR